MPPPARAKMSKAKLQFYVNSLMNQTGKTRAQLGKSIGMAPSYISGLLSGGHTISEVARKALELTYPKEWSAAAKQWEEFYTTAEKKEEKPETVDNSMTGILASLDEPFRRIEKQSKMIPAQLIAVSERLEKVERCLFQQGRLISAIAKELGVKVSMFDEFLAELKTTGAEAKAENDGG